MRANQVQRVLVIGAGGTGSLLLPSLVRLLRSIEDFNGNIIIADGDSYDEGNSARQLFSTKRVGQNKAEYQYEALVSQLPDMEDKISYIPEYLSQSDLGDIITENTIVINCADNFAVRKYAEDLVLNLRNGIHICCGNELRTGQVQIHIRNNGVSMTPSIYEQYPELDSEDGDRSSMSCEDLAALPGGGQLICANMTAASLALNFVDMAIGGHPIHLNGEYMPCDEVVFDVSQNNYMANGQRSIPEEVWQ